MSIRGIRGATTVSTNEASAILEATKELLLFIQNCNDALKPVDIASALFTMTTDLDAVYPAKAARQLGWTNVPLICTQEIPVPGGLPPLHTSIIELEYGFATGCNTSCLSP